MSYRHNGRTYHNRSDYERAMLDSKAADLQSANSRLEREKRGLESDISSIRTQMLGTQNNVREMARQQSKLEQKQQELQALQNSVRRRQEAFEQETQQKQQEMEEEIRASEERADQKIEDLRQTQRKMNSEVNRLRADMNQGLEQVQKEVQETRAYLDSKVEAVRHDFEEERRRRMKKEKSRITQAGDLIDWVEKQQAGLQDLNELNLIIEKTRVEESLKRSRELLKGDDKESALAIAESAFTAYQTVYLEVERRIGVINGVAEHVSDIAESLAKIATEEDLRVVFPFEAAQIELAAEALKARADDWRSTRKWTTFDAEHHRIVDHANALLSRALELESLVPNLIKRLGEREQKLDQISAAVAAISGSIDHFELGYANPEDVKSPRLMRARIGNARVDTYLDLDGTFKVDAYGFDSDVQCSQAAALMSKKLAETWMITEEHIDNWNRREATSAPPVVTDSWRQLSVELEGMKKKITDK